MQIQNTNNNSFTAIYKIPKTNIQAHLELANEIAPEFLKTKRVPIYIFSGECPYDAYVASELEKSVNKQNLSYDWLIENAKNNGIKIPDPKNIDVWVFTGTKDVKLIDQYTDEAGKILKTSLRQKIKNFFSTPERDNNIPEHLDIYTPMLKKLNLVTAKFKEIIEGQDIVEVPNTQVLSSKLLGNK